MATAIVERVRDGPLDRAGWAAVRANAAAIGIDEEYLAEKATSRFFSLLWLRDAHEIEPMHIAKRDRRGWVVLSARKTPRTRRNF